MQKNTFDISWVSLWKIAFFILLIVVLFGGRHILLGLFLAIVISSGVEQIVSFFERFGLSRIFGVILVFLLVLLLFILIFYAVAPALVSDLFAVVSNLNKVARDLGIGPLFNVKTATTLNSLLSQFSAKLFAAGASPLLVLSQIVGGVGFVLAVFVSSFYLSLSRDGVGRFIRAVFPADYEEAALRIYERSRRKIGSWFRTQILLSIIMGGLVWIVLSILGVPHAFLIAVFTAMLEIVPYVGPILAGTIAVAIAMNVSLPIAIYTLIAFVVLQQLENHLLVPYLTGRSVGLHPVIVIISLLIGAQSAGFLGIIIAVPAAGVLQEIIEEWSTKKRARLAEAV